MLFEDIREEAIRGILKNVRYPQDWELIDGFVTGYLTGELSRQSRDTVMPMIAIVHRESGETRLFNAFKLVPRLKDVACQLK